MGTSSLALPPQQHFVPLLQVSANVLIGRSHLGVHWRMDGVNGALVGETSAIRRLQQVP